MGTLQELEKTGDLQGKFTAEVIDPKGMACGDLFVKPFATSHDCAESVGFRIHTADDRTIVLATDLGLLTEEILEEMQGCDFVILESNHDVGMLQNGSYPYSLKKRILSQVGHLSNTVCADSLPRLAGSGTTRFLLAHLSEENNTPELALQTALCSLTMAGFQQGIDFQLGIAPRENVTGNPILF